jgi:hypothetical protein
MAKIIGYDETKYKQFTCRECAAIVEYAPNEAKTKLSEDGRPCTDEGTHIKGLTCPGCGVFHRTNP